MKFTLRRSSSCNAGIWQVSDALLPLANGSSRASMCDPLRYHR
jgi:hypothetical protein